MDERSADLERRLARAERRSAAASGVAGLALAGCALLAMRPGQASAVGGQPSAVSGQPSAVSSRRSAPPAQRVPGGQQPSTVTAPFRVVNAQGRTLLEVIDIRESESGAPAGPPEAKSGTALRLLDLDGNVCVRLESRARFGSLQLGAGKGQSRVDVDGHGWVSLLGKDGRGQATLETLEPGGSLTLANTRTLANVVRLGAGPDGSGQLLLAKPGAGNQRRVLYELPPPKKSPGKP